MQLSLGQYEDALQHLELAYESTPWDNGSRQLLGEALLVNGRIDEGTALWAQVNNAQGQLQSRKFWYEHIAHEERLTQIRAGIEGR